MPKFIKKNKILSLFVLITLIIITVFFTNYNKKQEEIAVTTESVNKIFETEIQRPPQSIQTTPTTPAKIQSTSKENKEKITVIVGEEKIYLSVIPNTTFYNALIEAKTENKISFSGKNYPGLGFFVTSIEKLHSSDGRYLFYYVNGKEATVGVSKYLLKNGDIIEWKLK